MAQGCLGFFHGKLFRGQEGVKGLKSGGVTHKPREMSGIGLKYREIMRQTPEQAASLAHSRQAGGRRAGGQAG